MTITAVAIEQEGWALALTGDWGASDWGDFDLDPDGEARISLEVVGTGFKRSGGAAVPDNAVKRTIVGTKVLRKPYPDHAQVDEGVNGNDRTLRIALSSVIYDSETVDLTIKAGWRAGEGADTFAGVTNNSNRAYPMPIMRWAIPSYMPPVASSTQRVEMIVAAHYPRHDGVALHQAVAGVKFVATDGTTTVSAWALGLSTSPYYTDGLRCWGGGSRSLDAEPRSGDGAGGSLPVAGGGQEDGRGL